MDSTLQPSLVFPTALEPEGVPEQSTRLRIRWSDGREFLPVYTELRFQCPCAGCVNELTGERMIRMESVARNVRPLGVDPVGRYAIKIRWSDGHETGMYSYDRLREICERAGA